MNKGMLSVGLLAFLLAFSLPSIASHCHGGCGCGYQQVKKFMLSQLDLNDEQKTQLQAVKSEYQKLMTEKKQEMRNFRMEMKVLVKEEKLDMDKLQALIDKKKALVEEITKNKILLKRKKYAILTEHQKQQLEQMKDKWKQNKDPSQCPLKNDNSPQKEAS